MSSNVAGHSDYRFSPRQILYTPIASLLCLLHSVRLQPKMDRRSWTDPVLFDACLLFAFIGDGIQGQRRVAIDAFAGTETSLRNYAHSSISACGAVHFCPGTECPAFRRAAQQFIGGRYRGAPSLKCLSIPQAAGAGSGWPNGWCAILAPLRIIVPNRPPAACPAQQEPTPTARKAQSAAPIPPMG